MQWLQVKVDTDSGGADAVEQALADLGAQAVTIEDTGDQPLLEPAPGAMPLWDQLCVVGLFPDDADRSAITTALGALEAADRPLTPRFTVLPDREWRRAWLDDWEPLCFGCHLWVAPFEAAVDAPGATVVRLDPGLAFGTGTHESTALCLEWLDAHPPSAVDVLDYGCGSGILAIAALRLGAPAAVATDIDPQALEATRSNAAANGVGDRLDVVDVTALPGHTFPVVLANILAAPLIGLAPDLAARQPPGGRIVLAGLLTDQAEAVCAAYEPYYRIEVGAEREGWVRLDGVRGGVEPVSGHARCAEQ